MEIRCEKCHNIIEQGEDNVVMVENVDDFILNTYTVKAHICNKCVYKLRNWLYYDKK